MTRFLPAALLSMSLLLSACTTTDQAENADKQIAVALIESGLLERINRSSVILLGEKHDNPAHHQVQASVLTNSLTAADGVVFEMLNRDQQPAIDQYLNGEISFADLPSVLNWEKSGWPDWAFYGPLFKAAKDANARILYGSYPKRELRGKMTATPESLMPLPDYFRTDLEEEIRLSHCNMLPENMIVPMSNIQTAKDRLLAEQVLKVRGDGRAFLIAGNGHVRKDRGVPYYLTQTSPSSSIFVLGLLEDPVPLFSDDPFNRFDSVWTTSSVPEKDYCAGLRKKFGK